MKFLSDEQISNLLPAETASFASPVPTQIVSSDEYLPVPQSAKQRQVEARLKELSAGLAKRQGLSRRRFFQTAAGMAASFVALNEIFGHVFEASPAEAANPDMANERAGALSGQFIIDGHTHFLRDDTKLLGFVAMRNAVGKTGWNKQLTDEGEQTERYHCYRIHLRMFRKTGSFRRMRYFRHAPQSTPRLAPSGCWRISRSRRGKTDGSIRLTRRSSATSPIRGRAIRSATTRTRSSRRIRGTPTTKS
jgi:hypothetical protein